MATMPPGRVSVKARVLSAERLLASRDGLDETSRTGRGTWRCGGTGAIKTDVDAEAQALGVVIVFVIEQSDNDYDDDNDNDNEGSRDGISVTTSVPIAPRGA